MNVLVINAGSSSLKYQLLNTETVHFKAVRHIMIAVSIR